MLLGRRRHLVLRFLVPQRTKFARIDQQAVLLGVGQRRVALAILRGLALLSRQDDNPDLQPVFLREIVIAIIMRRNRHDRARPVVQQDVVAHPHRQPLAVERIDGVVPREDAVLLNLPDVARLARFPLLIEQSRHRVR